MLAPTVDHRCWKVGVEPVKWMAASSGWVVATSETAAPLPVTMLMTPGGSPASSSRRMVKCAENCWVGEGFQTTTLPIRAGADGRFAAMAVKLNGVIARTKPSSGRYSIRFHTPGEETGWSLSSRRAKSTLKRRKSISSQAASISACCADLDWPRIVAPFSVCRYGPASRSAARRKIAARSSNGMARHAGAAPSAASIAERTSSAFASAVRPSTEEWLCGWTTSIEAPPPIRCSPPIVIVRSSWAPASSLTRFSSAARSALPGAYPSTGSLDGAGTVEMASITCLQGHEERRRRSPGARPAGA